MPTSNQTRRVDFGISKTGFRRSNADVFAGTAAGAVPAADFGRPQPPPGSRMHPGGRGLELQDRAEASGARTSTRTGRIITGASATFCRCFAQLVLPSGSSSMSPALRARSGMLLPFLLSSCSISGPFCPLEMVRVLFGQKRQKLILSFRLCSSPSCGSIARVNMSNRADVRVLERSSSF